MICNRYYYIILVFLFCLNPGGSAFAVQYGHVNNSLSIDYQKTDSKKELEKADVAFEYALKTTDTDKRNYALQTAAASYYIVTKTEFGNIYPVIQLGRVYDLQGRDKYARAAFDSALGINPNDRFANYYFGDYYYFRNEYGKALKYYREAFKNGLEENSSNLKKMAIIYEKLGDLQKANVYYKRTYLKNPSDNAIADKIRGIENVKYTNSDYYRRETK